MTPPTLQSRLGRKPVRANRPRPAPKKKRPGLFAAIGSLFSASRQRLSAPDMGLGLVGRLRNKREQGVAPPSRGAAAPPPLIENNPVSRLRFLAGLFMLAFVILAIRALDLTVLQRDTLLDIAQNQHRKRVVAAAHRGRFLDRNGRPLAISLPVKALSVDMDQVKNPRQLADRLAPLIDMDVDLLRNKLGHARPGTFPVLKRQLPPTATRDIRLLNDPSLFFIPESQRFYPLGEITSHLIGFVNHAGHGVEGLEQAYEEKLQGEPGVRIITRDRLGRPMPMVQTITPTRPGSDVALTIDTTIQYIAYRTLLKGVKSSGAKAGMVVVMDPRNGDILALVNQPGFNPNNLGNSEASGRRNRAIMDLFEPGSTFKIFTAAAALDTDVVKPDTVIDIHGGRFLVGDRIISDFHRGDQTLTVSQILQKSSNVGAAKIGLKMGNPAMEGYLYRFGFGSRTGVELGFESSGHIPDITHYTQVGLANRSYGYGMTATSLQLTTATAAAINGGLLYTPHLVSAIIKDGERFPTERLEPRRVIKPETSAQLRTILKDVVGPEGTAPRAAVTGYTVAGKTGTARKAIGRLGYVRGHYFASFVGFVPADDPQLVIFVGIDEPQGRYYGGQVAAPVFSEIAEEILPLLSLFPEKDTPLSLPPLRIENPDTKPKSRTRKEAEPSPEPPPPSLEETLLQASLGDALETLMKKGEVPLVQGSGQVKEVKKDKQGRTLLILE